MAKSEKREEEKTLSEDKNKDQKNDQEKISDQKVEETIEEKLKTTQEKLLRSMAETENQRRRFEKECYRNQLTLYLTMEEEEELLQEQAKDH